MGDLGDLRGTIPLPQRVTERCWPMITTTSSGGDRLGRRTLKVGARSSSSSQRGALLILIERGPIVMSAADSTSCILVPRASRVSLPRRAGAEPPRAPDSTA